MAIVVALAGVLRPFFPWMFCSGSRCADSGGVTCTRDEAAEQQVWIDRLSAGRKGDAPTAGDATRHQPGLFLRALGFICLTMVFSHGFSQWALLSQQRQLENKFIVASVEVEQLRGDLGSRPIYRVGYISAIGSNLCFSLPGITGFWGYGKKAGLILVDNQRNLWIAILDSVIGSIEVRVFPISVLGCP